MKYQLRIEETGEIVGEYETSVEAHEAMVEGVGYELIEILEA